MPYVYQGALHLQLQPKVDGGECARLVQHYIAHIGQTAFWRPGENVVDVLTSGRQIAQGTAIATFINGRYPTVGHRHAALFLWANTSCTHLAGANSCKFMSIHVMDQWNDHPGARVHKDKISARDIHVYGKNAAWPCSDNASTFYIIER